MKRTGFLLIAVAMLVYLCACDDRVTGRPDITGSRGQINQSIDRPYGWRQIVTESAFQLGTETWSVEEQIGSGSNPMTRKYREREFGTYPNLDGSTVCLPMAVEFARQHLSFDDKNANSIVDFNTTAKAYHNLITKEEEPTFNSVDGTLKTYTRIRPKPVDLIIVTEPSDDELELARNSDIELVIEPVCYDAFVFITHMENPVDSLSVEQVQKIYSGGITNWKEVGGLDQEIQAFQREQNSGSQTTMEKQVMQGIPMIPASMVNVSGGMGRLIEMVGEYENNQYSLGYTFKYYVDMLYKNENIKVLKIDGISPNAESIRNQAYPFTTSYYAVIRSEDRADIGGRFMDWMLSDEGQMCIEQAGYCPIRSSY